jgi:uncharacterized protein YjcR
MKNLTTSEAAVRIGVAPVTVRLWCRQGKFPSAYAEATPRGDVWYIPEGDLDGVGPTKPGPKSKVQPANGASSTPAKAIRRVSKPSNNINKEAGSARRNGNKGNKGNNGAKEA